MSRHGSDAAQSRDEAATGSGAAAASGTRVRVKSGHDEGSWCAHKEKAPPFGGAFFTHLPIRLAVLVRDLLTLTVGLLSARILLLLARLLAAALLLLPGLLTRVLVLLARIVLIGHEEFLRV